MRPRPRWSPGLLATAPARPLPSRSGSCEPVAVRGAELRSAALGCAGSHSAAATDLLRALDRPLLAGEDRPLGATRDAAVLADVVARGPVGDDAVRPAVTEPQCPSPGVDRADPIAPAHQVQHVDEGPHHIGREAGNLD